MRRLAAAKEFEEAEVSEHLQLLPGFVGKPLTIAEAKRRLAMSLSIDPSSIKITVEA